MNINEIYKKSLTGFNVKVRNRTEFLNYIGTKFKNSGVINSKESFLSGIKAREAQVSTALIEGVAFPHVQISTVQKTSLGFFKLEKPIIWDKNKSLVDTIFVIAVPKAKASDHLTILSKISAGLVDDNTVKKVKSLRNFEDSKKLFTTMTQKTAPKVSDKSGSYDIVAVTSCPTGIAHTYMAAESIVRSAKKMGLRVKVETQGTDRTENKLTSMDISNAKGIILAIDRGISMDRFNKKKVLEVSTKSVIKDAKAVINRALGGEGKFIRNQSQQNSSDLQPIEQGEKFTFSKGSFKQIGKTAYRSLLTGVSHMLPFVVFGGIFIALAFLIDIDNAGASNYGSGSTEAIWFKTLGDIAFGLFVPVLAGYMCFSVVGKVGLLPGFIIGMIANGNFVKNGKIGFFNEATSASGFLGAIIGAFIVIGVIILLRKLFYKAPKSLHGIVAVLAMPLFSTLIAGTLMWLVNIPLGIANNEISTGLQSVATSGPIMVAIGLLIGSMMAFDMGGPINKAAYVFGVFTLKATPDSAVMAQVMLAGMIPPLSIAISTTFSPKMWNKEERQAGYTNWVMGLSFITEGAIPFAAKRPKVIIPSIIIGSAIGAMTLGLFSIGDGVTLAAPHGGIFVFALLKYGTNIGIGVAAFLFCLVVGSVVGALMIPLFRKITKVKIVQDKDVQNLFEKIFKRGLPQKRRARA